MDGLSISNLSNNVQGVEAFKESTSTKLQGPAPEGQMSFADSLKDAINTVDKLQKSADVQMQNLATGKSQNIHETMIAAEKAELALRLMIQVRNKVIDAYQDIMKMQV